MDSNLLGLPSIEQVTLLTAGGGDVDLALTPPVGEIWLVKALGGFHDDDAAPREYVWQLVDLISGITITLNPYAAVAQYIRCPLPFTQVDGPFLTCQGGITVHLIFRLLAAGKSGYLQALVHKIKGVSPLV
jgi:hypothetical protein